MAKEVLVSIRVESGQAAAGTDKVRKSVNQLESAKKKLNYELSEEAKELAKVNEAIRQQRIANKQAVMSNTKLSKSVRGTTGALQKNRAQAGLNNAILIETGRVASDSAFGIQGVANNIGRLTELFQEFSRTGGGGVMTAFKELGKSLMGVGGLIVGFQLLLSFLPQIMKKFEELRGSSDDVSDVFKEVGKSAANTTAEFNSYIGKLQDATTTQMEFDDTVAALEKDFPKYMGQLKAAGVSIDDVKNKTADATAVNNNYRESILEVAKARAVASKIEELTAKNIQAELDAEIKLRDDFNMSMAEAIQLNEELGEVDERNIGSGRKATAERDKVAAGERRRAANVIKDLEEEKQKRNELIKSLIPQTIARRAEIQAVNDLSAANRGEVDKYVDYVSRKKALEKDITDDLKRNVKERIAVSKIEVDSKGKDLQLMLAALSKFLKSASEIAEGNKDLARAAIIASAAAASVGVWEAWLVKDKTPTPAPVKVAGAIATQVAILASTMSALKSLNSNQPIGSSGGAAGGGAQVAAPEFNVVGASGTSQLAGAIGGLNQQPIKAFVVGKDITTQQELDRNIVNTAGI
jgi:hypothetical protein